MSKDLKTIISSLKSNPAISDPLVFDPEKKRAAARVLKYYAKLPQELRTAMVPALQEITGK